MMLRNKKGKLYVAFLAGFMIITLIGVYVQLAAYYAQNNSYEVKEPIGAKQARILDAIQKGERMATYVDASAVLAAQDAANKPNCREEYLTYPYAGTGSCKPIDEQHFLQMLAPYLAVYPQMPLSDVAWTVALGGGRVQLEGTKKIPLERNVQTAATLTSAFGGTFTTEPVPNMRITSLFGNRLVKQVDANGKKPTTNHPGIDISVGTSTQTPLYSVMPGTISVEDSGVTQAVVITQLPLIVKYRHTTLAPDVHSGDTVQAGSILAYPLYYPTTNEKGEIVDSTHLHFEVIYSPLTASQAKTFWPEHVGLSDAILTQQSFGVIARATDQLYLDPVCFFDRALIRASLERSQKTEPSVFAACAAYEEKLGLSKKLQPIPVASQTAVGANAGSPQSTANSPVTTAQSAASAAASTVANAAGITTSPTFDLAKAPAEVQLTHKRIAELGLDALITQAAQENGISKELLLAIITQESKGNPLAVSDTGAAGLMQFTYGTATGQEYNDATKQWVKKQTTYDDIFSKAKPCNCDGTTGCPTRVCTAANDDRFDPQRSIRAGARYLGRLHKMFATYDQADALTIAAYNGGEGTMLKAATQAGGNHASWDQISAALGSLPGSVDEAQIRDYVNKVRTWYVAWGGVGIIGTSYSTENLGYYDVRLATQTPIAQAYATVVAAIDRAALLCDTQDCIKGAVLTAPRPSEIDIDPVRPEDAAGTCMSPAEEAQFYVTNQLEWCRRARDTGCGCAISAPFDASFTISAGESRIKKLNGKDVANSKIPSGPGISLHDDPDGQKQSYVTYVKSLAYLTAGWPQTIAQKEEKDLQRSGELVFRQGRAPTITPVEPQSPDFTHDFVTLFKDEDELVFSGAPVQECVMPAHPALYCLRTAQDPTANTLIAVSLAAHSFPLSTISDIEVTPPSFLQQPFRTPGRGDAIIQFTATAPYRAVRVVIKEKPLFVSITPRVYFEDYQPLVVTGPNFDLPVGYPVDSSGAPARAALWNTTHFRVSAPYYAGAQVYLSFIDENFRETQQASADLS